MQSNEYLDMNLTYTSLLPAINLVNMPVIYCTEYANHQPCLNVSCIFSHRVDLRNAKLMLSICEYTANVAIAVDASGIT